jgi:hypothetical protein
MALEVDKTAYRNSRPTKKGTLRTCERILKYAQKVLWRPSVEQALIDLRYSLMESQSKKKWLVSLDADELEFSFLTDERLLRQLHSIRPKPCLRASGDASLPPNATE